MRLDSGHRSPWIAGVRELVAILDRLARYDPSGQIPRLSGSALVATVLAAKSDAASTLGRHQQARISPPAWHAPPPRRHRRVVGRHGQTMVGQGLPVHVPGYVGALHRAAEVVGGHVMSAAPDGLASDGVMAAGDRGVIAESQGSSVPTILLALPSPVHPKKLFTRDGVVLAFMARLKSVQPCELL